MIEELSKMEKELEGNEYFENGLGWYMTFDVPDTIAPLTEIDNGLEYISALLLGRDHRLLPRDGR